MNNDNNNNYFCEHIELTSTRVYGFDAEDKDRIRSAGTPSTSTTLSIDTIYRGWFHLQDRYQCLSCQTIWSSDKHDACHNFCQLLVFQHNYLTLYCDACKNTYWRDNNMLSKSISSCTVTHSLLRDSLTYLTTDNSKYIRMYISPR